MASPQPDAELALPWPGRKDQLNGSDRVIGTHSLSSWLLRSQMPDLPCPPVRKIDQVNGSGRAYRHPEDSSPRL